jgi:hypothetical protein
MISILVVTAILGSAILLDDRAGYAAGQLIPATVPQANRAVRA